MIHWFRSSSHRRSKPFLLLDVRPLSLCLYWVQAQRDPIQLGLLAEVAVVPKDMNSTLTAISGIVSGNLPCREIAVVMNSPLIHHQTVSIPPMRAEERKRVLQQEMKHAGSSLQDQDTLSFWSFGKQIDAGRVMEKVLCAQMPRHLANEIVEVLEQKNLQPIGLTSHSQMVCHLLREANITDIANVALVEVNEWDGMITLFRSGVWSMERRFLTGNPAGRSKATMGVQPEVDLGQVLLEMGRAFQYFKQQFRNENIGRILVYGSSQNSDAVCKALETSFDVPVGLFIDDKGRFDVKSPKGGNTQPGKLLLYSIPCSAALYARFQEYIDFLPERLRERSRVAGARMAVAALLLVLYGWLGTMWWTVSREAGRINPHLMQETSPANSNSAAQEQQLIQARSLAIAALQSERWLRNRHEAVGALVRELAQSAPPEMKITSMQLLEKPQGWEVNLQGEVRSRDGSRSQELLVDFRSRCRGKIHLSKLGLSEVSILDSSLDAVADSSVKSSDQNLLTFRMTGLVPYAASGKG